MSELHCIVDDLRPEWLEEFATRGVTGLEALLARHAAFRDFLRETGRDA